MIVFIVPAMVFLPSSRLSRRPDFSTKKTATVNATNTKKKTDREVLLHVHVQLHVLAFIPDHSLDIPLGTQTSQFACPGPLPAGLVNPISPNINIQILLTDLSPFPFRTSWKNLIKDQKFFSL